MTKKIISSVIEKKVKDWIKSIQSPSLKESLLDHVIVTGGCITSMLCNEEVKDFDIYFDDLQTTKAVANYYVNLFNAKQQDRKGTSHAEVIVGDGRELKKEYNSNREILFTEKDRVAIYVNTGVGETEESEAEGFTSNEEALDGVEETPVDTQAEKKSDYRVLFLTSNAITLKGKVQLVIRFYGDPKEIHKNYDFVHATNYWTNKEGLVHNVQALEAILTKQLIYVGSKYPLASIIRVRKFVKRGWSISAGQLLKIMYQISGMNLNDVAILNEQLMGVDSVYFAILIQELRKDIEAGGTIDANKIATLVDKIF